MCMLIKIQNYFTPFVNLKDELELPSKCSQNIKFPSILHLRMSCLFLRLKFKVYKYIKA